MFILLNNKTPLEEEEPMGQIRNYVVSSKNKDFFFTKIIVAQFQCFVNKKARKLWNKKKKTN